MSADEMFKELDFKAIKSKILQECGKLFYENEETNTRIIFNIKDECFCIEDYAKGFEGKSIYAGVAILKAINKKCEEMRMDIEKNISNLKQYIEEDDIYKKYKEPIEVVLSDFDMFCINHCKDIEVVLKELEEKELDYTTVYIKGFEDCKSKYRKKIQEKIDELKGKSGGNVFHIQQTINAEIRLLEELLKDKGE